MYMIAVFTNRTDTLYFYNILKQNRIACQVINTPNRAQFSCSISVKFSRQFYAVAVNILRRYNLSSFLKFMYI